MTTSQDVRTLSRATRQITRLVLACATILTMSFSRDADAVSAGIMGGGSIYSAGTAGMDALRASGFNTVILWTLHVYYPSGDLIFNSFPICTGGMYVANANFPAQLATLKQAPTSVNRIEVAVGSGGGPNDFLAVQKLMNDFGTGTNTMLYRNFQALIAATGADAVCFNDETLYDVATMVNFGRMLTNIGVKVTLCPYNNPTVWQNVKSQLGSAVDAIYLQCYSGGAGNNPSTWNGYFGGLKVSPGLWCKHGTGCTSGDSAATVTTKMSNWKNSPGIPGGWMWLHDDMLKCTANSMADYATAITGVTVEELVTEATWDGGGSNNAWTNRFNWTNDAAPSAGATLYFAGTTRLSPSNNFPAGTNFASIYFNAGAGAFTLSGNEIALSSRIQNSSTNPQTMGLPISLATGSTVWIYTMLNSGDLTISGVIGGGGNLLKSQQAASTTLILGGSNTYSGGTTINAGNVSISSIKVMGSPEPSSFGMPAPGNGTIGMGTASRLIYTGPGDMTDREFELQGSPLRLTHSGTGHLKFSGDFTVNVSGTKALTLDGSLGGTGEIAGVVFNPPESGNTRIVKDGSGTWILSGANAYLGTTVINAGDLLIGADSPSGNPGALGAATTAVRLGALTGTNDASLLTDGAFVVGRDIEIATNSSGTLILGGRTAHASTFSGSIDLARRVQLTAGDGGMVVFAGSLSNTGGIDKIGGGTVTLSGTNTYSGSTRIVDGTLAMGPSGSIANSTEIVVAAEASFDVAMTGIPFLIGGIQTLRGAGTVTGNVVVAGTVDPGVDSSPAALTVAGDVSLGPTATLRIDADTSSNDILRCSGNVTISGAVLIVSGSFTNETHVIVSADGTLSGTFSGLTNGAKVGATGYAIHYATTGTPSRVLLSRIEPAIKYVIHISVDGMHASAPRTLIEAGLGPNFKRMYDEGAYTDHARTDYDSTVTSPNHATMLTGRPVKDWPGKPGHLWGNNDTHPWDRWELTLHMPHIVGTNYGPGPGEVFVFTNAQYYADSGPNKTNYEYVSSVFDVVKDSGRRTSLVYGKSRILVEEHSYDGTHGRRAPNLGASDPGVSKIDHAQYVGPFGVISNWMPEMVASPFHYSFLHFSLMDDRGHSYTWSFTNRWRADLGEFESNWNTNQNRYFPASYMGAIQTIDGYLGEIFDLIETNAELNGKTAIIITTDHGGLLGAFDHGYISQPDCFQINIFAWGPGIPAAAELYALNRQYTNPGPTNRPDYNASARPLRNGDTGNLALSLLGLGPIPGSTIDSDQSFGAVDSDGDGLSDNYETTILTDPYDADTDHDGSTDGDELTAGTIATDSNSLLRVSSFGVTESESNAVISWLSVSNRRYSLWGSSNVVDGFFLITNDLDASPAVNTFTNVMEGAEKMLYRISAKP